MRALADSERTSDMKASQTSETGYELETSSRFDSSDQAEATELDALAERLGDKYGLRLSLGHFALSVRCPDCS